MTEKRFATLITCIDGRIQTPLHEWIRKNYQVDYVDTVTEPGVDKLAQQEQLDRIRRCAMISSRAHGSKLIVVSGHHQCAANPGTREKHVPQIRRLADAAGSWGLGCTIVGVWVNEDWQVELVTEPDS